MRHTNKNARICQTKYVSTCHLNYGANIYFCFLIKSYIYLKKKKKKKIMRGPFEATVLTLNLF